MQLIEEPEHIDYVGNCWLIALSTFLGVSTYEAHVLVFGGPPPPPRHNFVYTIQELEARFPAIGFVRARKTYRKSAEPRYVVGCWLNQRVSFGSLHAVAWDGSTMHDPAGWDSLGHRKALTLCVYRLAKPERAKVLGVYHRLETTHYEDLLPGMRGEAPKAAELPQRNPRRITDNALILAA